MTAVRRGGMLAIATLLLLAAPVMATSYLAPYRPPTEEDVLLNSCETSDAVVLAEIRDLRDEFFARVRDPRTGAFVSVANAFVVRSLKGKIPAGSRIRIQLGWSSSRDLLEAEQRPVTGILFLEKWGGDRKAYKRSPRGSLPEWIVSTGPYTTERGFVATGGSARGSLENDVRRAVRLVEPDSLAGISDVVLLANLLRSSEMCSLDRVQVPCARVSMLRQLYGSRVELDCRVCMPVPGYVLPGFQALFLRRVSAGVYEPIGLMAGARRVKGKDVSGGTRTLSDLVERVEAAERNRLKKQRFSRD